MAAYIEVLLPIYIIILLIALIGNTLFFVAVILNKKLKKTAFIILANQCLSDLLFNFLSIFDAVQYATSDWVFGLHVCRIQSTMIEITYTVSGLSLCSVAVKRYMEICFDCKVSGHKVRRCILICFAIWLASFTISSPLFYANSVSVYTNTSHNNNAIISRRCGTNCAVSVWINKADLIYHCVQFSLIYLTPLIILSFTSAKIIYTLLNNTRKKSQCLRRQKRSKERKQIMLKENARNMKITKLLTIITICFFVLWTPFVVIRIAQSVMAVPELSFTVCQLFLFASSAPNFYITYAMSAVFRKTVKRLVRMRKNTVDCHIPTKGTKEYLSLLRKRRRSKTKEKRTNIKKQLGLS